MTTKMTPPYQGIASVSFPPEEGEGEWTTVHEGKDGLFDIPDHAAPGLAAQGWVTHAEAADDKPPVGFAKPRTRKARATEDGAE